MSKLKYPLPEKENIVDEYHGTSVPDPYRYMEDPDDPRTLKFIEENNKLVESILSPEVRKYYQNNLTEVFRETLFPFSFSKVGDSYYYQMRESLSPQPVIYQRTNGKDIPILDINSLSEDGTTAVTTMSVSPNEKYLCVTLSIHGSDWQKISVFDIEKGIFIDEIEWVRFTNIEWLDDSSGFYYQRFPNQNEVSEEDKAKFAKLYFHKIGTSYHSDQIVFDPGDKTFTVAPLLFEGKHLFVMSNNSTMPENRLFYRKEGTDNFVSIVPELNGYSYVVIGTKNNRAYLISSDDAPNKKILSLDLATPSFQNMEVVVDEMNYPLTLATLTHDKIAIVILRNAVHILQIYSLDGSLLKELPLPSMGSIAEIYGRSDLSELIFSHESFFSPRTIFIYDVLSDSLKTFISNPSKIIPHDLNVRQIFYTSKDGTKIPMFILSKKDLPLNSKNPTLLYGYGGFSISLTPSFVPHIIPWLMDGGIYAVANLRGGGEYGEKWHVAGILEKKQNVFDDFIAAAEYLIEKKYTSPQKLAINGRSNGGLLVGAVLTQRPELFGAAVPQVGVLDMLRYPLFTIGRFWVKEYGDALNNPEHFKFIYKYSPLHNIRKNISYPPTLVTAAEGDNRVVPAHSLKFTATLQQTYNGDNPILLRIERKAGHGFGKPLSKIIEDLSYMYAFLAISLNVTPPDL